MSMQLRNEINRLLLTKTMCLDIDLHLAVQVPQRPTPSYIKYYMRNCPSDEDAANHREI